jgi:hypothetical protein
MDFHFVVNTMHHKVVTIDVSTNDVYNMGHCQAAWRGGKERAYLRDPDRGAYDFGNVIGELKKGITP